MEISRIAERMGIPEERVAQMMQMVRERGMPEEQMAPMMRMAAEKGLAAREIAETMCTLGMPADSVVRVMRGEGVVDEDGAKALLAEFAPAPESGGRQASGVWLERFKKAGVIVFWLAVWEIADRVVDNRLILAGPIRTLQALAEQVVQPDFALVCAASFGRISLGFLLAFAVGFALALLCYKVRAARYFLDPIISLLKTIPMASFVILLLIWVGTQALTVYLAFLIVVPIIYTNVLTGLESANAHMLEMARVFGLSKWRKFWYVYRPAFMPFLYSSCKLSLGMSWKAGIMAELLAVPALSIGKEMYAARTFLDTPDLLAWTAVVMVLALAFEKAFLWLLRRLQKPMGGSLGAKGGVSDAGATAAGLCGGSGKAGEGARFSVEGVSKAFGANRVLRSCTFDVDAGGIVCLMAPSGSGKTTLFRVVLGLERADAGAVRGADAGSVSMMFQEDRLCEALTAVENVLLACPKSTRRADARALLEEILPAGCMEQPVSELSGGMRRRVSLARAMAHSGSLVILDEPFTGLDAETRSRAIEFIVRCKGPRTLLVATHGEGDAQALGARSVVLGQVSKGAGL